jgi:DNA-binding XRE family transcriptional regulator
MRWTVETLAPVNAEIEALPIGLQARVVRLLEMIENIGLEQMHEPHVKHLEGKLWELRAKAREGIARGIYVAVEGAPGGGSARVRQENRKDATASSRPGARTTKTGGIMTKIADLKKRLMANEEFRAEYEKADAEFAVLEALVRARTKANLTQAELARRIGTTQSAIARLEGGRVSPSLATLRRYADATGAKLQISLVAR